MLVCVCTNVCLCVVAMTEPFDKEFEEVRAVNLTGSILGICGQLKNVKTGQHK